MADVTPIERYLRLLDDGEFEAAAQLFASDAVYARPGLERAPGGGAPSFAGLVVVRGREAILEYFRRRGKQPYRHVILGSGIAGSTCFAELTLAGYGSHLEALAVAEIDAHGLINRYVALSTPVGEAAAGVLLPPGVSS
jgi:hypothetical protein